MANTRFCTGSNVFCTMSEPNPWLAVDLGSTQYVSLVNILTDTNRRGMLADSSGNCIVLISQPICIIEQWPIKISIFCFVNILFQDSPTVPWTTWHSLIQKCTFCVIMFICIRPATAYYCYSRSLYNLRNACGVELWIIIIKTLVLKYHRDVMFFSLHIWNRIQWESDSDNEIWCKQSDLI